MIHLYRSAVAVEKHQLSCVKRRFWGTSVDVFKSSAQCFGGKGNGFDLTGSKNELMLTSEKPGITVASPVTARFGNL